MKSRTGRHEAFYLLAKHEVTSSWTFSNHSPENKITRERAIVPGFFAVGLYFFCVFVYNIIKEFLNSQKKKGCFVMNLARVSSNGQVTVPIEIRRLLGLKAGDKILFFQKSNGEIVMTNASANAVLKAQEAFAGVAEELKIKNEEDVQALVDELRHKGE